jgi:hypothetical protein
LKTAFNPSKGWFKVASFMKILLLIMKKMQPQKMSLYRKLWWFLNKKRGRNDLFLICAPSLVGSCNHKAMIELASFKKLK